MFDRNTIIALVVVGLMLLLLPTYYKWIAPPAPEPTQTPQAPANPTPSDSAKLVDPVKTATLDSSPIPHPSSPDSAPLRPYVREQVRVETPLYAMTLGSDGRISSCVLKSYQYKSGGDVKLHQIAASLDSAIGFVDLDLGPRNITSLTNLYFESSKPQLTVTTGRDSIELVSTDNQGRRLYLYYVIDSERYGFALNIRTSGYVQTDTREFNLSWKGGVPTTEPDPQSDHEFGGAYAMIGEELENISLGSDPKAEVVATGRTSYVATRSKYFIAALIPQAPAAGAELRAYTRNPSDKYVPHVYSATLRMPWESVDIAQRVEVYWGPIKEDNLKVYDVGLEDTMNWGWAIVKPFSKSVLWLLIFLGGFIKNYGIVIIIFSVVVKVLLWPLTRKSQIAMKRMSALKPELEELKEKHAKNPAALNKAMMALYKERGANPAAGCIPMLLQMPILYGLFIVFRSTIEFRQAPFLGWISDLSQPDFLFTLPFSIPLYGAGVGLLPIVMGVSQFYMSRATMSDPNQKAMLYIMPVMMTVLFNNFPSGLTLYYTLFNIWAIVEQQLIKLPVVATAPYTIEDKPQKKKK